MEEALTRDPVKFADTLTALPAGAGSQFLPDFLVRWTERDYNAAATWLRGAPPKAPWRDAAVESLVQKITPIDPAAAQAWTLTIADPAIRSRLAGE